MKRWLNSIYLRIGTSPSDAASCHILDILSLVFFFFFFFQALLLCSGYSQLTGQINKKSHWSMLTAKGTILNLNPSFIVHFCLGKCISSLDTLKIPCSLWPKTYLGEGKIIKLIMLDLLMFFFFFFVRFLTLSELSYDWVVVLYLGQKTIIVMT